MFYINLLSSISTVFGVVFYDMEGGTDSKKK